MGSVALFTANIISHVLGDVRMGRGHTGVVLRIVVAVQSPVHIKVTQLVTLTQLSLLVCWVLLGAACQHLGIGGPLESVIKSKDTTSGRLVAAGTCGIQVFIYATSASA
jgi:hypothetical protein